MNVCPAVYLAIRRNDSCAVTAELNRSIRSSKRTVSRCVETRVGRIPHEVALYISPTTTVGMVGMQCTHTSRMYIICTSALRLGLPSGQA